MALLFLSRFGDRKSKYILIILMSTSLNAIKYAANITFNDYMIILRCFLCQSYLAHLIDTFPIVLLLVIAHAAL